MKDHEFQCCMVAGWVTDDIQRCASAWGRQQPSNHGSVHKHRRWTGFTSNCAQNCWHVRKHIAVLERTIKTWSLYWPCNCDTWVQCNFGWGLFFLRPYVSFQQNYFHAPRCIAVDLQKINIAMTLQTYVPIKVKDKELDGLKMANNFWGARSLQYSWENIRRYNHPQPQVVHISLRFQVS